MPRIKHQDADDFALAAAAVAVAARDQDALYDKALRAIQHEGGFIAMWELLADAGCALESACQSKGTWDANMAGGSRWGEEYDYVASVEGMAHMVLVHCVETKSKPSPSELAKIASLSLISE